MTKKTRSLSILAGLVASGGLAALLTNPGHADIAAASLVQLQSTTPGLTQNGHIHISGVGIFGRVDGINPTTSGTVYGVMGQTASTGGNGIFGNATATTGSACGVWGQTSSVGGAGVLGTNFATSGAAIGIHGFIQSQSGSAVAGTAVAASGQTNGVYGESYSSSGTGVFGNATASSGSAVGVWGQTNSSTGAGIIGTNLAATGNTIGIHGYAQSSGGTALVGTVTAPNGATKGVYGESLSTGGVGVFGYATATSGNTQGVTGYVNSDFGAGVFGNAFSMTGPATGVSGVTYSNAGVGTYGLAWQNTGLCYGLLGDCPSPAGYGVFANGNIGASGTKSFVIDHPLDPENKLLKHYCAEGPEPQNIYNGNVTTNAKGEAWVQLPDYYDSINKDPRYMLTVIDDGGAAGFVQAKVASKIKGNTFMILTSAPHVEVSWMVFAKRNDLWVRTYGAPVEMAKEGEMKGKYQQPQLYGQPESLRMVERPTVSK
jgi:hypothetical protein